jgi:hypothetical protein
MRESELLESNRFVRGIKKIHDRLLAMVRLYDQLRAAHVTLAVALSFDLSRFRKASLIPLSRFWGPAAIDHRAARLGRAIANRRVRPGVRVDRGPGFSRQRSVPALSYRRSPCATVASPPKADIHWRERDVRFVP